VKPGAYVGSISAPSTPPHTWPKVIHDGVVWLVSPVYVAPVARVDLAALLNEYDCELPTVGLVDAIWRAADLKLEPHTRDWRNSADMASPRAFADQKRIIEEQIGGRAFTLLAGTHKDFVQVDGRVDIYGWADPRGKKLQPSPLTSHNAVYVDYSQGYRPVRRVGSISTYDGSIA